MSQNDYVHPHARISDICTKAGIRLQKGMAAEIYKATNSTEKNMVLATALTLITESDSGAQALNKARLAQLKHIETILPEIIARHPFANPAKIENSIKETISPFAGYTENCDLDKRVTEAVSNAYAHERASAMIPEARKRAKKADVNLLKGEPNVSSIISSGLDLDKWIARQIEQEHEAFLPLPDASIIAGEQSPLFVPIVGSENSAGYIALKEAIATARHILPQRMSFADVIIRHCVLRNIDAPEKNVIEQSIKAREEEIKEVARKLDEWNRSLVNAPAARSALGARPTEFTRWVENGLIPVAKVVEFYKWGQNLDANYFDPAAFPSIMAEMPKWRDKHKKTVQASRKKVVKSAESRQQAVDAQSDAFFRRVKSLAKSISIIGGVEVRKKPPYSELVFKFANTIWLDLSADIGFPCRMSASVSIHISPATTASIAQKAPLGKARKIIVSTLEVTINEASSALLQKMYAEAATWKSRVLEAAAGYPSEAFPRIGAAISDTLHAIETAGDVANVFKRFQQEIHKSIDNGMKLFLNRERATMTRQRCGLSDYSALFPVARAIKRKLILHVGPTNSGKTHTALELLAAAPSGVYASPLRLMALENFERLNELGVPCSLITGEERTIVENARHVSCTIETADFDTVVDTAIIDEIQMLGDPERGWAWTSALIGLPAKTVIMTGSSDAIPRIQAIVAMTDDDLEIRTFERLTPLLTENTKVTLHDLTQGDAVIAFSRNEVLRLRQAIIDSGKKVAVIYGALGPEVRRAEARRFRSGDADILVATDAIGMGLNIGPLRRVLFSALNKFDGKQNRPLTHSEIRQIGGRAGRYGHHENGFVGVLGNADLSRIDKALSAPNVPHSDVRAYVMPPYRAVATIAEVTKTQSLRKILSYFAKTVLDEDPLLLAPEIDSSMELASCVDQSTLDLHTKFGYLGVPLDTKANNAGLVVSWAKKHGLGQKIGWKQNKIPTDPSTDSDLHRLEVEVKSLSMYIWLSLKWPDIYVSHDDAVTCRKQCNDLIEKALKKSFLHRTCRDCGTKLHRDHRFPICDRCHRERRDDY